MHRQALQDYLNDLLEVPKFKDYCPNGLQVEGKEEINMLITGVTACQALIEAAIEHQADAILVHHGYFWKGEAPELTGPKRKRCQTLLAHNINLFAYHLPLDAHPTLGNNAQLANKMGWEFSHLFDTGTPNPLACFGQLPSPSRPDVFAQALSDTLGQAPLHLPGGPEHIQTVAWCTGAAQDFIEAAAAEGADAFVTGEASERTTHLAQELGIHCFSAGHHATERYGVQALGDHIATTSALEHRYIEIPNPV